MKKEETKEKRFRVLVDGNFDIGSSGFTLPELRTLLEDKDGDEGFNIPSEKIDEVMKEVDGIEFDKDFFKTKTVTVECDSEDFGKGNGLVEIMRIA